jgi:NADPH2:quinone reductase
LLGYVQKDNNIMGKMMICAAYQEKGKAGDVLKIVERPALEPSADEVRVRVATSGINPSDVKMRAGAGNNSAVMPFPEVIPHSDGAGIIDVIGAAKETMIDGAGNTLRHGDRVYIFNAGWQRAHGTAGEYVTLPTTQVIALPDQISFSHGAALGIPAMTAAHAVLTGRGVDGGCVLISGGGGVVGRYAIQMARAAGAKQIIATASTPLSMATAKEAGADHVLDYRMDKLEAAIMDISGGINHAIEPEFGQNADMLAGVLKANASITSYGSAAMMRPEIPFYPLMFKNITLNMMLVYLLDHTARTAAAKAIDGWLRDGSITEHIASILPLKDAAKGHDLVEKGEKSGSVILKISDQF